MVGFFVCLLLADAPIKAEIAFQDGSLIKIMMQEIALEVQTKYGKLSIPINEIHRVDFGKVDSVQTIDGIILGKITNQMIRCKSLYFGDLVLKVLDLKSLQLRLNSGLEIEKVIEADGNWLDTGLQVSKGDGFLLTAMGQVDLWPQGPGQYMAMAKGYSAPGKGSTWPAGALLVKIAGKTGHEKVFSPGDRWEGTLDISGKVWLYIVPSPWDNLSQGSYRVKILGR